MLKLLGFLGLKAQLIGGSGDTDVLLTANIGNESYKVSVDGKTSKQDRITDNQIDWLSLRDHRKKNQAEFVIVVGSAFAGGNLESRAREHIVSLLKTEDLIRLIEAHGAFPVTLTELKELFSGYGDATSRVEDLITQSSAGRNLIKQFKTVVEEMQAVQNGKLGYFTLQSLVAREKIESIDIEPEQIEYIIRLLQLPFIDGISSLLDNQYLMTIGMADLANIFFQISQILLKKEEEAIVPPIEEPPVSEPDTATRYFEWTARKDTVVASARKENPYLHYCPIDHFKKIVRIILSTFEEQNIINKDTIYSRLEGRELAPGRPFKGHPEEYKI